MSVLVTPPPIIPAGYAVFPTLQAIQGGPIADIAGVCATQTSFVSYINQATNRLLYRGDWRSTTFPIQLNVMKGVITFPRIAGTVRAINICKRGMPIFGQWFRFLDHYWRGRDCWGWWHGFLGETPSMTEYGYSPIYAAIPTNTCVLQLQGDPTDNGAIIQVFGTDPSGNQLLTSTGTGFVDGLSFTLGQPFVVGTQLIGSITRVIKPITNQYVEAFALDTASGTLTQLANWEPSNTSPHYAQYKLEGGPWCTVQTPIPAVALIKIKFVPVVVGTDPVLIPNQDALKLMVQAIRFEESGDSANGAAYIAKAVHELNLQLADQVKEEDIPVFVNAFGSATPGRAGIGKVI
jgi:hypothetical protein